MTFTVSRLGQVNAAGDVDESFLTKFAGEVIRTYTNICDVERLGLMVKKTTTGTNALQFPVYGTATMKFHTSGENTLIEGTYNQAIRQATRLVYTDRERLAQVIVEKWDELVNHWEVRGPMAEELGKAIALDYDKNAIRKLILAARTEANISGGNAGSSRFNTTGITDPSACAHADMDTDAGVFTDAVYAAAQRLDEYNVPKNRYCFLKWSMFYKLLQLPTTTTRISPLNQDYSTGNGDFGKGMLKQIAGVTLVPTNQIPTADESGTPTPVGASSVYGADYTKTEGIVFTPYATGVLTVADVKLEAEYRQELRGTFTTASKIYGMGILQPEHVVELCNDTTP